MGWRHVTMQHITSAHPVYYVFQFISLSKLYRKMNLKAPLFAFSPVFSASLVTGMTYPVTECSLIICMIPPTLGFQLLN